MSLSRRPEDDGTVRRVDGRTGGGRTDGRADGRELGRVTIAHRHVELQCAGSLTDRIQTYI